MKRFHLFVVSGLAVVALALIPSLALAWGARSGDNVTLAKGETHRGTLFAAGDTVSVDGDVDGDLICAGNAVVVNGAVHGDVLCAGRTITISGAVDGSVRAAGQTVTVNGPVSRNITVGAQTFTLGPDGRADGEVALFSQTATINGPVKRDLYGSLENLALNAMVTGNLDAQVTQLTLAGDGRVTGDLSYTSEKTFAISSDKVGGKVTRHALEPRPEHQESPRDSFFGWLSGWAFWTLSGLAVALLFVWLMPRPVKHVISTMASRPGPSIGWGLLVMFVTPLAVVALLLTIVGLPVALILVGAWLLALAVSGVFVALAAGQWILGRTHWNEKSLLWAAVVGVPVTVLVFSLPAVGMLLSLVGTWWALGALMLSLRTTRA